jgi:hypothetical protein
VGRPHTPPRSLDTCHQPHDKDCTIAGHSRPPSGSSCRFGVTLNRRLHRRWYCTCPWPAFVFLLLLRKRNIHRFKKDWGFSTAFTDR